MAHTGFNTFDLIASAFVLVTGVHAFRRGFVKEVFMLGTWTGASVIAATYYTALTPWIMSHDIKNKLAADAIATLSLFGLALLVLIPTVNFLAGLIKGPTLTSIDRSLGFVFGLMKGLLILCLLFLCLSFVWPEEKDQPTWLVQAKSRPLLADGADMIRNFVPKEDRERAQEIADEHRRTTEQAAAEAQHLEEISTPVPAWLRKDKNKAADSIDSTSTGSSGNEAINKTNELLDTDQP